MSRAKKDTEAWSEAHRQRLADPLAHLRQRHEGFGLSWTDLLHTCGAAEMEWWWRNHQAIELLREVEGFGCKTRARILFEHVETLDDEALPPDFYKRLVVAMRDARLAPDKAMARDRNSRIRMVWPAVYSEIARQWQQESGRHPQKYAGAIELLATDMHMNASQVKRAIEDKSFPEPPRKPDDFSRLIDKRVQVQKQLRK